MPTTRDPGAVRWWEEWVGWENCMVLCSGFNFFLIKKIEMIEMITNCDMGKSLRLIHDSA